MKQYKQLLIDIQQKGTVKPSARPGMPGTTSLFGYQFRHDLADGFPAITTKKLYWKGVVIELLWFLKGDTNIKFLDQHGVTKMWHEDAYNYYEKKCKQQNLYPVTFDDFCRIVKEDVNIETLESVHGGVLKDYTLGDCGMQYGKLWRNWEGINREVIVLKTTNLPPDSIEKFREKWRQTVQEQKDVLIHSDNDRFDIQPLYNRTDQIQELIDGLKNNPMGRRHILTAWNPTTLNDMALNACHAMVQWNCRPIQDRLELYKKSQQHKERLEEGEFGKHQDLGNKSLDEYFDKIGIPKYHLDCQLYQRSADVFLGAPLNIASYALLTEMFCKICNMVPGDFIHTFGDVHIYDNHKDQVEEQLKREERSLPQLIINNGFVTKWDNIWTQDIDKIVADIIEGGWENIFQLKNYDPHPTIQGKLSTGLK